MNELEPRPPSTGNPADYVYIEDLTDYGKGKCVVYSNMTMPEEADSAFHQWLQGRSHKSGSDLVTPAATTFSRIMGFSPEQLLATAEELKSSL